jgi:uncharacterized protein YdhG (YjbR/CyaY superfamily)
MGEVRAVSIIDDYLAQVEPPEREALARICRIARQVVPEAEEALSYGMPAFKYRQRPLLGFTAKKHHLSLHPFSPSVIEAVKDELRDYDVSKGTIRFTPDTAIPEGTLRRIIDARLKEIIAAR